MKKRVLISLLILAMVSALLVAALPAAAETEAADRAYCALDMFDSFSKKFYHIAHEYFFENGLWTVEYYDRATQSFAPMAAYYSGQVHLGVVGGASNFFTVNEGCATVRNEYTYCLVSCRGRLLPSTGADSVVTFIAPMDGVITYDAVVNAYSIQNTAERMPDTYGTEIALWRNDEKVWPKDEDRKILTYDLGDVPLTVENLSVKKGDRIRLSVGAHGGKHENKGVNLTSLPLVTYTSADQPLKDSVDGAPSVVWVTDKNVGGSSVTWLAVDNAVGYHIYVGDRRVTETPVSVERYGFPKTDSAKDGDLTVTAVGPDGKESEHSAPALSIKIESFRGEFDSKGITYRIGRDLYNERGDVYASVPLPNTDTSSENTSSSDTDTGTDSVTDTTTDTTTDLPAPSSDPITTEPVTDTGGDPSASSSDSAEAITTAPSSVGTHQNPGSYQGGNTLDGSMGVASESSSLPLIRIVLAVAAGIAVGITVFLFLKDRKAKS